MIIKTLLIATLVCLSNASMANELHGTVCLGKNLSIIASDHSDRLHFTIDDSAKFYFDKPFIAPKIVAKSLDINIEHIVSVYYDNKVVHSWSLNFSKLKTNSVLIWRAKGAWRMAPNKALGFDCTLSQETINNDSESI